MHTSVGTALRVLLPLLALHTTADVAAAGSRVNNERCE